MTTPEDWKEIGYWWYSDANCWVDGAVVAHRAYGLDPLAAQWKVTIYCKDEDEAFDTALRVKYS